MRNARLLARSLRDPSFVPSLAPAEWTALISLARAEMLIGTLAHRLHGLDLPAPLQVLLQDARADADQARRQALWEAEMARRALAPLGIPVILLKGTAYAAAGLSAGLGRSIGDLDILVPRKSLDQVQEALLAAGWEWVKDNDYDQLYYRRWMHELPPLIHRERDRMIDVHHTILPLTARPTPDAEAMIADSEVLADGLRILAPADMIVHSAAHLFADGDLAGGLRNLWDIHQMLQDFGSRPGFWAELHRRARLHQVEADVARALRLSAKLYGSPVDAAVAGRSRTSDRLFERRLLARNGWGQGTRRATRMAFYVRSHWMRMPPLMLARHLLIKSRG